MRSFSFPFASLCLTLGLAGFLAGAESATGTSAEHYHLRQVPTLSKGGQMMRSVACTESHPAPPAGPEHVHRWFKTGEKRPGEWTTWTCTQIHAESQDKACPLSSPKSGCAHKPRC